MMKFQRKKSWSSYGPILSSVTCPFTSSGDTGVLRISSTASAAFRHLSVPLRLCVSTNHAQTLRITVFGTPLLTANIDI